ncbi:hypothetical protein PCC6912_57510 [Chlorogloeopsis fritschii PCC 6912]|uniref:vWA-MoxR associated protein N-terminal HTH domain-containing protein n=2 Tax=Chlorogloeopsis fritschii TaxID=1124 RepID=A0A3S1A9U6_CHLFR|nr:hypothetical protein [Chlorogloeopsis fritschii]RUR73393.1 hypothetical protein PCC6912_57510 [Chlorogloeopsis fritschii PCC 6912]
MGIEEALQFIDELLAKTGECLSETQRIVFVASWQGQKYGEIMVPNYAPGYIERTVAPELWNLLSRIIEKKVTKKNLRSVIEQVWLQHSQLEGFQTQENSTLIENYSEEDAIASEFEFCPAHILFHQHYQETFTIESSSNSDLCYIFINTRHFKNCKARLLRTISQYKSDENFSASVQEAVVWSLLGNAELLITFRATNNVVDSFNESLHEELSGILDEPHDGSHYGIFLIKISDEYSRVHTHNYFQPQEEIFQPGRRLYQKEFPYEELRSVKAFIKLRFVGDGTISDRLIANISTNIREFKDVLEGYSVSIDRRYIIIEVHMPCGRLFRLNQLSKLLEDVLNNNLLKETYLAYDLNYHT